MLLLESSPTSTGKCKDNFHVCNKGGIITDPYWLYLEGSFYPYLAFLNFRGSIEGKRKGIGLGQQGHLMDRAIGSNTWRQRYCTVQERYTLESFRRMLSEVCRAK